MELLEKLCWATCWQRERAWNKKTKRQKWQKDKNIHFDPFGHIWTHVDSFGPNWAHLDLANPGYISDPYTPDAVKNLNPNFFDLKLIWATWTWVQLYLNWCVYLQFVCFFTRYHWTRTSAENVCAAHKVGPLTFTAQCNTHLTRCWQQKLSSAKL